MMSSDIFFLVCSRITAVLEVHTQINLQGFFFQSLFNFQGASHSASLASARLYYQIHLHLSTPFFNIFYPCSQPFRAFHPTRSHNSLVCQRVLGFVHLFCRLKTFFIKLCFVLFSALFLQIILQF